MPADSVKSARAWTKSRGQELGSKPKSNSQSNLTEQRREKLRLECAILALRLERERDDVDLISVDEIRKFVVHFYSFSKSALRGRAENLVNELMGQSEPMTYAILRDTFNNQLFETVLSWMRGSADPRLIESARKFLRCAYLVKDGDIDLWLGKWEGK